MNQTTQFGPYKLIDRISVGGMAEVYKAVETGVEGFERTVAVKRILPHIAEDDEFITMFKDEAKIAGQLTHGNIAQIYNLGQQDDSFYIAMEYVAGKDARSIFTRCQQKGRPMPIAQACFIVMKVGEGLDYAHNKKDKHGRHLNIIHRDVSPPNILVSYEGEVKLIDFGVAKAAGRVSRTQAGILKGKFGYMSPEQVRGMPLDRRSDVFALGVVLYELLTGTRLFQGETDFATLEKVRSVDVPLPSKRNPEIPKDLEAVVMKALAGEPETRYQTAMELHDALQGFMFSNEMFYSRKDLAAWMRKNYSREIDLEKGTVKKSGGPRPPIPGRTSSSKGPPSPRPRSGGAPKPPVPRSGPRPPGGPRPGVRAGSGGNNLQPSAEQLAAMRKRSKTMLMSGSRPNTLRAGDRRGPGTGSQPSVGAPPRPGTARPGPPRPKPKGGPKPAAAASDFDWDDDELETRLFDDAVKASPEPEPEVELEPEPIAAPTPSPAPAPVPTPAGRKPAQPIATVAEPAGRKPAQPIAQARPMTPAQPIARAVPTPAPAPAPAPFANPAASGPRHPGAVASPFAQTTPDDLELPKSPVQKFVDNVKAKPVPYLAGLVGVVVILIIAIVLASGGKETPEDTPPDETTDETKTEVAAVKPGTLTLELTPADATVTVDGNEIAGMSPRVISELDSEKPHKIVVSKGDTFLPFEQEVSVPSGGNLPLPVKLQLKEVTLAVDSDPSGASISLVKGDEVIPQKKSTFKIEREAGVDYQVEAEKKGYETTRVPLTFTGEAAQEVKVVLIKEGEAPPEEPPPEETSDDTTKKKNNNSQPKAKKTATLKIGAVPPAEVYVDGRKQSKKTPVVVQVTPGTHKVKFKWSNGKSNTQKVTVGDKEEKIVRGKP
ncbi:MAG: serine/threonine protein kinase [Myxococcales bacterium]|nr:serine/threonine protein kinase [Myxococcales bacterium]